LNQAEFEHEVDDVSLSFWGQDMYLAGDTPAHRLMPSPQGHRGFVGAVRIAEGFPCGGGQCSCLHRQRQCCTEVADLLSGFELCDGAQENDGSGWQDEAPPRPDVLLDGLTDPGIH